MMHYANEALESLSDTIAGELPETDDEDCDEVRTQAADAILEVLSDPGQVSAATIAAVVAEWVRAAGPSDIGRLRDGLKPVLDWGAKRQ